MPFKNPHPLYQTWNSMKQRCYNKNNPSYHNYGGRGIKICNRWHHFHNFASDMSEKPPNHSIDRIDNDGEYSPENCRWATKREQQRNRRKPVFVTIEGKEYRAIELADIVGCKTDTIIARAERGLSFDEVMSKEPLRDLSGLALGGKASGAKNRAKTHCPKGHEYTEANTQVSKAGRRSCRKCRAERERLRYRRKKEGR